MNQTPSHLTPDDARILVIASALSGAAKEDTPAGWLVERAFHLGDRVKGHLEAEARGQPLQHWTHFQKPDDPNE